MDIKEIAKKAFELHKSGSLQEAEKLYLQVIENDAQNASVLNLLGLLYFSEKKLDSAQHFIEKALIISPQSYFYLNLGRVFVEKNEYKKAIEIYEKAIDSEKNDYEIWFNYALALSGEKMYKESANAYEKALELKPDLIEAYYNLSKIYSGVENNPERAIEYYKKILEQNPNDTEVLYFLSTMYLKTKDFDNGWKYFENRLCRPCAILTQEKELGEKIVKKPIWNGENLANKTIFVYFEGGLGETTMFSRFLPMLVEKGAKVYFRPQSCYYDLYRENEKELGVEVINDVTAIDFDYHLPMLSLPYALKIHNEAQIPLKKGHLKANPKKVFEYKQNYFNTSKFKVGIKWQGNTSYDLTRVIDFEAFYKIFPLEKIQFYSLQKDDGVEELKKAKDKNYNIVALGDTFNNFCDTAAAIENLDLVICNDTSVAHLAATLSKPTWVLLPQVADWRWHVDITKCEWYDNVKLFQQKTEGDWISVMDDVYDELKNLV